MKKRDLLKRVGIVLVCILASQSMLAQGSRDDNKWHLKLEPYTMLSYMSGESGIGKLPDVKIDQKANDILRNLSTGGMLYAELYKGRWSVSSDLIYMKLENNVIGANEILRGDLVGKQLNWEVAGLYKVTPWLDLGVAAQLNSLKVETDIMIHYENEVLGNSYELSETWVDPSIVARIESPFGDPKKWQFSLRGNIGGFGIGSDLFWQAQAQVGYQFSKVFQFSTGYRAVSVDYEKGKDKDRFKYEMLTHGPFVKLGFNIF